MIWKLVAAVASGLAAILTGWLGLAASAAGDSLVAGLLLPTSLAFLAGAVVTLVED